MSARVISIANSKGGVGKTTTTVSLAEAFAAEGRRVLVVDLDTQANASLLVFGNEGDEHLFQAISDYATISDWLLENFEANEQKRLEEYIVTDASDVTANGKPLPLDLIFLDASGRVLNVIADAVPFSEEHLPSDGVTRAVLEVNAGLAARYGIGPGAEARHPGFGAEADWPC